MSDDIKKPEELAQVDYNPPNKKWTDPIVKFRKGTFNYASVPNKLDYLDLPNPGKWQPPNDKWPIPENWKEIILKGLKDRLDKYRSLKIFMDICVSFGACADK